MKRFFRRSGRDSCLVENLIGSTKQGADELGSAGFNGTDERWTAGAHVQSAARREAESRIPSEA